MKKSLNITLNSLVFNMEEDAYERLKEYLGSIERYYKNTKEEQEIINDIESSIAEKFQEKIKSAQTAISLEDVEEVIKIMGTVAEITAIDENSSEHENSEKTTNTKRKLYRDTDDVVLAGICSGIAIYLGIDALFVRLLFIAITFANGIGLLFYFILWIIVPKAKTNKQKLEMQGKSVNLSEIEQAVKKNSKIISEKSKKALKSLKQDNLMIKILNLPIVIVKSTIIFIKKIAAILWIPASVIFGSLTLIGSIISIIGASIVSTLMIININSPYLNSDLPLTKLASMPQYYIMIISCYVSIILPMVFLSALAIMLIRKKNSFRLVSTSILTGIWMLAIIIFIVSIINLTPVVNTYLNDDTKNIQKEFDFNNFNKLYLGGNQDTVISKGNEFSINFSGRQVDLERLDFKIEDGQLQITQKKPNGICIFCNNHKISGQIIMPELESYVAVNSASAEIIDFNEDLYLSLGESAKTEIKLAGQNIKGRLSGVKSKLSLSGEANEINFTMDGAANFETQELNAQNITLNTDIFSQADLNGKTFNLNIKSKGYSHINAFEMTAKNAEIIAKDSANIKIFVQEKLFPQSYDNAVIYYLGKPKIDNAVSTDNSRIIENDNKNQTFDISN